LAALFGSGPVGLAIFDAELNFVWLNEALVELHEQPLSEQIGRPLRRVVPEIASVVEPELARVLADGEAVHDHEVTRASGRLVHARASYVPVLLRDSSARGVAGIVNDVTELKLAQSAIAERARFETLLAEFAVRFGETRPEHSERAILDLLQGICSFHGFPRASVFRFSAETAALEHTHVWGGPHDSRLARQVKERELEWLRLERERIAGAELVATQPGGQPVLVSEPSAATFAVPMEAVGFRGALVWHLGQGPSLPTPASIERLRAVAQLIAGALSVQRRVEVNRTSLYQPSSALDASCNLPSPPSPSIASGEPPSDPRLLIGESPAMREVLETVEAVAPTNATVLIQGESGVGKELLARVLHNRSGRAEGPLVTVNCASIPRDLFESEFFGHVRGAFTGAHRDRVGRFELADGGTLFLDEVAEIPLELQSKLLRVLQENEFERLGDDRTRRVDVRVISATNRNLESETRLGAFRQDLYYRLSVFPVRVPPLRERPEDILVLSHHFLETHARALNRSGLTLTLEHERILLEYRWPGNVRELYNVIERAVIQSPRPPLRLDLAVPRNRNSIIPSDLPPQSFLTAAQFRERERQNILAALGASGWRIGGIGGAAELLGMRPSTLRDRLKALGIRRP
jgi:PAS domain S-box-containing protein